MSEHDDRPGWQRWQETDDWFAEPEQAPAAGDEVWLEQREEQPPPERRSTPTGQAVIAVAVAVAAAVLLLVLWAAGVFDSGAPAQQTMPSTTTTRPTTTVRAPAPAAVRPPTTTLTPGSNGVQVKRLQRALARLGYSPGRVDGSYGAATVAALKRFQLAMRLEPDGALGPKTLRALKAKLAAS